MPPLDPAGSHGVWTHTLIAASLLLNSSSNPVWDG